ncbi:MAG: DUF255 domain-containing protein [Fusobacteria bacterium]|nr:DUF255 domain-containing protein [Fusobacteriota bacterium]
MKKILLVLVALFLVLLAFAETTSSTPNQKASTIRWQPYSQAFAQAQKQNKLVYVYIGSDTCYYCKKMEQETFTDKNVISVLNNNYIATEINIDKNPSLASQFNVQGTPVSVFITPNQKIIGQIPGYLPSKDFISALNYVTKKYTP